MKRVLSTLMGFMMCLSVLAQSQRVSLLKEEFYSLYQDYLKVGDSKDPRSAEDVLSSIRSRFGSLSGRERDDVIDAIIDDTVSSYDPENNDLFLSAAERALVILPQDEPSRFNILLTMGEVYATRRNKEMLLSTINQMKQMPISSQRDNIAAIEDLQEKADSISSFPQVLNGYWVSSHYMTDSDMRGRPWIILDIFSDKQGKWAQISELSGMAGGDLDKDYSRLRKSDEFDFDVRKGSFKFAFHSSSAKRGNAGISNSLYDSAQETKAIVDAYDSGGRASSGEVFATTFTGTLLSKTFETLARNAAVSRMTDDVIYIIGTRSNDDVLTVHLDFEQQRMDSRTMKVRTDTFEDVSFEFWRWKKEYGIVFGQSNCKPINPYVTKLSKGMELYDIKRQTSFWNLKYGGVSLLGFGLGAASTYYGIKSIYSQNWRYYKRQYGVSETEAKKMAEDNADGGVTFKGFAFALLGSIVSISVPIFARDARVQKRQKMLGSYNKAQYDRFYNLVDDL